MKALTKILFLVLFPAVVFAQTAISWFATSGQSTTRSFTIDPTWSGTLSVKAYHTIGGKLVSAQLQPSASKSSNTLLVTFSGLSTLGLPRQTYIEITTGPTVRYKGYLTLTASGTTSSANKISVDQVLGLSELLATKVDKDGSKVLTDVNFTTGQQLKIESSLNSINNIYNALNGKGNAFTGSDNSWTGANTFFLTMEGANQTVLDVQPEIGLADAINPVGLRVNATTYGSPNPDLGPVDLIQVKVNGNRKFAVDTSGMVSAANLSLNHAFVTETYPVPKSISIVYANASVASFSVILPNVETVIGRVFTVKRLNSGSNLVYVTSYAGTFDGAANYQLTGINKVVTVQATSSGYMVIGNN